MRSFTSAILASASLFAATSLAASSGPGPNWQNNYGPWSGEVDARDTSGSCMSDKDAQGVANNFQQLIAAYSDSLANATLTTDFHDYTDSVIELIDSGCYDNPVKLGVPTFDSRPSFEKGQGSQPAIPFQQLNVWHNCDAVWLRWVSEQSPSQVTGIIVLETVYQNSKWLIQNVYSEFNSGAWLVNLGVFKPQNCGHQGGHP